MLLKFVDEQGKLATVELGIRPLVIGRSMEADLVLHDEKVSRFHCEIRTWDGEFVIKDLKSRNGTWVNDVRVEAAVLKTDDKLRVGSTVFDAVRKPQKGTRTILREVISEREGGKGYQTVLREIVESAGPKKGVRKPPETRKRTST